MTTGRHEAPAAGPVPYHQVGDIRLYAGDCAEVLPLLDISPGLVLTSPPYDEIREYGGDIFDFDRVADAIVDVMPEGGVLVWVVADGTVDGSRTGTSARQTLGFLDRGLRLHDSLVFEKSQSLNWTPNRYCQTHETMQVFSRGRPAVANILEDKPNVTAGRRERAHTQGLVRGKRLKHDRTITIGEYGRRGSVWRYNVGANHTAPDYPNHGHPAPFPLALARDHIMTWTRPGDLVLDPMAGSGTTLRAAADLGRHAVGIEIYDKYVQGAAGRISQSVMAVHELDNPMKDEKPERRQTCLT